MNRRFATAILVGAMITAPAPAGAATPVALELVLAVDVSSSVDGVEYRLQMAGIAAALQAPEVRAAINATAPAGVAIAVVQWASGQDQEVVAGGWARLRDGTDIEAFAARVGAAPRRFVWGQTGIGEALAFATAELEGNRFAGARRVIDVSGDGKANHGVLPRPQRDQARARGVTVNGLAILTNHADLATYYRDHVVGGPGAFVLEAASYRDFAAAMTTKLLREISPPVAALPAPRRVAGADQRRWPQWRGDFRRAAPRTRPPAYQYLPVTMQRAPSERAGRTSGDARP